MPCDLDELAALVRVYGVVLAYGDDGAALAFRSRLPAALRRAIRSHRRGLARMMLAGDIRLCPAPDAHRREYFYCGRGRWACAACVRLDSYQLGLWPMVG
jgi:hypothetical protein